MKFKFFNSLILCLLLLSCNEDTESVLLTTEQSTWQIIQEEIFQEDCVSCHSAGSSFARQSDLILTDDKAYSQLINRIPKNAAAANDGLLLVGNKGLESLYSSFLWEKINFPDFEHYYTDHSDYGELMPFGGPALTNGQLRYISEWIMEGAPDQGIVADKTLLDDTIRFIIPEEDFNPLELPQQGMQLRLGPFEVGAHRERELFQYQHLNNQEELYVNKVEINMRSGSHHFILYDFPEGNEPSSDGYRDFYNENDQFNFATALSILEQRFVFGTQWRITDYTFPEGVALKMQKNMGFDLNSHYVNRGDEPIIGEVSVNLHTVPKSEVKYVANNIFENYTDINIPANKITTLERTSIFREKMHIFQLTSHAHEHNTEFKIYVIGGPQDGELIYLSNDWEHPPLLEIDPPLVLEKGQGLRAVATYDNKTNRNLKFGLRSEDEMMIIFGAFYTE